MSATPSAPKGSAPGRARRTALIVAAPIVAVLTLMVGLRVGAGDAVRSATLFAAPPGRPPATDAPTPLSWQLLTYLEDRGVRETISMQNLVVIARAKGSEARWTGASNVDGIAEVNLALPNIVVGDTIDIEVRIEGEAQPLAAGALVWREVSWGRSHARDAEERAGVAPSKREGALAIDVVIEGDRLVVGFETPIWVRAQPATPGAPKPEGLTVEVSGEAGLRTPKEHLDVTCEGGWVEVPVVAEGLTVGAQIKAKSKDGATGEWLGALPIAPGAFFIGAPRVVPADKKEPVVLVAPNPRKVVYAEVDDEVGRVFAAALDVNVEPGDPTPRARFEMPLLAKGLHWLVVSGEPRGAEHLAGAAIAKPFVVGAEDDRACSNGPWLAKRSAVGFPRWVALDGMAVRGASNRRKHSIGLAIGLVSLFAAGTLVTLLLIAASREARAVLLLAELDGDDDGGAAAREKVTAKPPGGGIAVVLLIAILGFALLAALVVAKG